MTLCLRHLCFLLFFITLLSCRENPSGTGPASSVDVPCREGGEPNLFVSRAGTVYLSWIEYLDDTTDALVFSRLENDTWSSPTEIARGNDWFVNWADFPSLVVYSDDENTLAAHWLQKSASGTYDYDIHITQSMDGGRTWRPSFILHSDSIAAEHGFVSLLPLPEGKIFATWLDGRNTKIIEQNTHDHGHDHGHGHGGGHGQGGAMSLRSAVFDKAGQVTERRQLDSRVCDCCQTAAVLTPIQPLVAYRNRSEKEYRDIYFTRQVSGGWTQSVPAYADFWHIAGCPVNGPALAAKGNTVALAWYTAAQGEPRVYVTFSKNGGISFGDPVRIDNGQPEGRVDVVLIDEEQALVSWLERTEEGGEIRVVKAGPEGKSGPGLQVSPTSLSRSSGFPRMEINGEQLIFAWTEVTGVEEETTRIRSAVMDAAGF